MHLFLQLQNVHEFCYSELAIHREVSETLMK